MANLIAYLPGKDCGTCRRDRVLKIGDFIEKSSIAIGTVVIFLNSHTVEACCKSVQKCELIDWDLGEKGRSGLQY